MFSFVIVGVIYWSVFKVIVFVWTEKIVRVVVELLFFYFFRVGIGGGEIFFVMCCKRYIFLSK